jgi:RNA polymerase sigma-70 factor (ECF subfamily)
MSPSDKIDETTGERWRLLAARAQGGDRAAYNSLLREIQPFIYKAIAGTLARPDWADDIVQDVLLSVHKSLKTYSPSMPFKPWLGAIIGFRRTDCLRRHYSARMDKQTTLEDPGYTNSHVTNSRHAGEYKDIERALGELPAKQRRVFEMIRIEGYSAKETANEMKMSVSAVKVSAHRAMKKLQDKLK